MDDEMELHRIHLASGLVRLTEALQCDPNCSVVSVRLAEGRDIAVITYLGGTKKHVNIAFDNVQAAILDVMIHGIFDMQ